MTGSQELKEFGAIKQNKLIWARKVGQAELSILGLPRGEKVWVRLGDGYSQGGKVGQVRLQTLKLARRAPAYAKPAC